MKRHPNLRPIALAALGVFLGRGAQAETILDFDILPPGQTNNTAILQSFGDHAATTSDGVTVAGFGTPNVGLTWQATGGQWDYYLDSVWSAGQLDSSNVGDRHEIVFTPNSPQAAVVIKSFNFHPYYVSNERYTYDVSVLAGTTVVSGPTNVTFISESIKVPVSINYTGSIGQSLTLRLARVASAPSGNEVEGGAQAIAVDDITFAPPPPLVINSIVRNGPNVTISWNGAPGVRLQKSAGLTSPNWGDVSGTDGASSYTDSTSQPGAFYRLIQ